MGSKKNVLADAILVLCEQKKLEQITVSDLLRTTGISRQTFYDHFRDKQDLIAYVYTSKVIEIWEETCKRTDMANGCKAFFENMLEYRIFMRQALAIKAQNDLTDCLFALMDSYLQEQHIALYGRPMSRELSAAAWYNIYGTTGLVKEWVVNGMTVPPAQIARYVMACCSPAISRFLSDIDRYHASLREA